MNELNHNNDVAEFVIDALNKAVKDGGTVTREIISKFVAMYSVELDWNIDQETVEKMVQEKVAFKL